MEILAVHGFEARCVAKGVERRVNLLMLKDEVLVAGDHVLVHLGFAVQKLARESAEAHWQLLDELMGPGSNEPPERQISPSVELEPGQGSPDA